jgi:beta-lactam-binding protein with PASTA domain
MAPQIKIVVSSSGEIKTEVQGVAGPSCAQLSAWLSQLGETVDEGATADFYKADEQATDAWLQSSSGS